MCIRDSLGNTSKRRGLETVLKAVPEIVKSITNFKLVIVGSSSYDQELVELAKSYNILKYIDFVGWKNENLFPSYIKAAHLGVSPLNNNLHHHTTYANKLFQYMSLGCPLICSNVEAQKVLLETYNIGLLFKTKNSKDLVQQIFKLYSDDDLRKLMSENCIDVIQNHLNNDIISKSLVNYYDQ